ncbi:tRNA pseudouridine(55) synthase TruB [Marinilactibacillus psychrotolerans]|uniref:tRNA pseudouridine synthase B n=2 Tax=Marinilactibacillus psychrotolerans TaxID=191770 RepID=A0A5R9C5G9_9LACT|nr:tRNA pseudouridine(55) synthase TruB [Marinilactibacillus psychrotolerans]TLQ08247.1 tRNA pseudouridine(55) synthase TruB [Marinilactibacillus psychrotolerans]GEQ32721.1 tRNA pseudouridine synthase B [Marinilactibacillus psychrotolerans]SJN38806.1 tRNA pseudouridine synthase B [Marinilactibacillus psychrotolerans 42ea]
MEGIIPLWKEKGMTSHDCVFKMRKILKTKKIGHSGTLDPDVEGVLPIAIGKATKVIEYMVDSKKTYEGEITLGYSTTTEDRSGEVVSSKPVDSDLSIEDIDKIMSSFIGEIIQTPPMYSAVKVNGKRLYEYARAGEKIERPSRAVNIYNYERTSDVNYNKIANTASFAFKVSCSKGTYVRTLAVDTGESLGFPAHMSKLIRTESGGYQSSDSFTLAQVKEAMDNLEIEKIIKPLETVLTPFSAYELNEEEWNRVRNGALIPKAEIPGNKKMPVVFYINQKAVAIYSDHPTKLDLLKPIKVLRTEL